MHVSYYVFRLQLFIIYLVKSDAIEFNLIIEYVFSAGIKLETRINANRRPSQTGSYSIKSAHRNSQN